MFQSKWRFSSKDEEKPGTVQFDHKTFDPWCFTFLVIVVCHGFGIGIRIGILKES